MDTLDRMMRQTYSTSHLPGLRGTSSLLKLCGICSQVVSSTTPSHICPVGIVYETASTGTNYMRMAPLAGLGKYIAEFKVYYV